MFFSFATSPLVLHARQIKKTTARKREVGARCDVIFKKLLRTQTVINVVLYGSHSNIYILNVATSSIRLVLCWTHHKKGNSTLTPPWSWFRLGCSERERVKLRRETNIVLCLESHTAVMMPNFTRCSCLHIMHNIVIKKVVRKANFFFLLLYTCGGKNPLHYWWYVAFSHCCCCFLSFHSL